MIRYLKFILFSLIAITLLNLSCVGTRFQKEGLVFVHNYYSESTKLRSIQSLEDSIWFKDSCAIYLQKVFQEKEDHIGDSSITTNSYDIYKYTYIDLRTSRCQDYYHFSDTAMPFCNYLLKANEFAGWGFYVDKGPHDISDNTITLSDTTIENRVLKRIRTVNFFANSPSVEYIFYIDCNAKPNIFTMNRTLDERYRGCKVIKHEMIDYRTNLKLIFEYKIMKDNLNKQERDIFNAWSKNATETKLPFISLSEANILGTYLYP